LSSARLKRRSGKVEEFETRTGGVFIKTHGFHCIGGYAMRKKKCRAGEEGKLGGGGCGLQEVMLWVANKRVSGKDLHGGDETFVRKE